MYRSCYCGLCKRMKSRYGFLSTLFLQYDCAFFYALLSAVLKEKTGAEKCRCLHHAADPKRRFALPSPALDFSAALNVLLAYYKCADDWADEKSLKKGLGALALARAKKKAIKDYPALGKAALEYTLRQKAAEKDEDTGIDKAADPTASFLREAGLLLPVPEEEKLPFGWLLYNLGRWVYLIDAWDDREKDKKKGAFNPYLLLNSSPDDAAFGLFASLNEAQKAFDLLTLTKNKGLLENILFMGCPEKTRSVLSLKYKEERDESL